MLINGICLEVLQQDKLNHWWVSLQDKDMDPTFSNPDTKIIPRLIWHLAYLCRVNLLDYLVYWWKPKTLLFSVCPQYKLTKNKYYKKFMDSVPIVTHSFIKRFHAIITKRRLPPPDVIEWPLIVGYRKLCILMILWTNFMGKFAWNLTALQSQAETKAVSF